LEKLYNQNLEKYLVIGTEKVLAIRLELSWKLSKLRRNLPSTLKPITSQEILQEQATPTITIDHLRLRIFLTLRYLNTEILIHRAVLFKYLDYEFNLDSDSQELELLRSSGWCSLQECKTRCMEIIRMVATLLNPAKEFEAITLFGAWYHSSYFGKFAPSAELFSIFAEPLSL
jgi:hypothetical protein